MFTFKIGGVFPDPELLTGAPFQWASIFHKKDIRFTHGVGSLEFYKEQHIEKDPDLPCKVYCSNCNGAIMDEGRNMCLVFPELINFDSEKGAKIFDVKSVKPRLRSYVCHVEA